MVDIAYEMGCNPIVLIGQDLAYLNNKTHAKGTTYENDKVKNKKMIKVKDINGDEIETSKPFYSMITYFNDYFNKRKNERIFIDATEGGAKINHTKTMSLKKVDELYLNKVIDPMKILDNKYKKENVSFEEAKNLILETKKELEESIKVIEKQLKKIDDVLLSLKNDRLNNNQINKLEKEVSKFDNKLKETKYIYHFVERTLIPEIMKLEQAKAKYYMTKEQSLEERLKIHKNFRNKFLVELKTSLELLNEVVSKKL
jgi:hypothetical protein